MSHFMPMSFRTRYEALLRNANLEAPLPVCTCIRFTPQACIPSHALGSRDYNTTALVLFTQSSWPVLKWLRFT